MTVSPKLLARDLATAAWYCKRCYI